MFLAHFHTALLVVYGLDLVLWFFTSFQENSGEWAVRLDRIAANYLRTWFVVDLVAVVQALYPEPKPKPTNAGPDPRPRPRPRPHAHTRPRPRACKSRPTPRTVPRPTPTPRREIIRARTPMHARSQNITSPSPRLMQVPWAVGPWGTPGLPSVPVLAMLKVLRLSHALSNQGIGSSLPMTSLGGVLMRFSRMFVGFFLLVHWFACTFYAVATITGEAEDPYLARLAALAPWERYVIELYNALSMMLGERMDGEPDARRAAVAMVAMLTGALVVAAVFGNVAVLITSINMSETRQQEKMDRINESMSTCRLPLELQAVIRQYYLYSWARHKESASSMFVEQRCQTLASAQCPSSAPTPPLKRRAPGVSVASPEGMILSGGDVLGRVPEPAAFSKLPIPCTAFDTFPAGRGPLSCAAPQGAPRALPRRAGRGAHLQAARRGRARNARALGQRRDLQP